ncbi:hypothetical protein WICPIJ_009511 [Wickerhamomyces pijperi]|uniref:t-SNARE coiled-coil homology domain-containing protein n=1 Tax=Wickerhamomyces pijperi TaxID=599730 RepID=A0A9P8PML9_WICPI|nr:hypothetical protein WICPIJ_009511 [Wickerhamomyces pijperi]
MSFLNMDLEAQTNGSQIASQNKPTQEDKTQLIISKTSISLSDFAQGVESLERLINQIGTRHDSSELRENVKGVQLPKLKEFKTKLDHLLNDMSALNIPAQHQFKVEKLNKEFQNILRKYSALKRTFNERTNSILVNDTYKHNEESLRSTESTPLISSDSQLQQQQQQQQQLYTISQQELDVHTLLTEQRASDISRIHDGVQEVNTVYKQLGNLVQQQGTQVDTIENNLGNFRVQAKGASEELRKAEDYQKRKGKWTCFILMVLAIFSLIVVLMVLG